MRSAYVLLSALIGLFRRRTNRRLLVSKGDMFLTGRRSPIEPIWTSASEAAGRGWGFSIVMKDADCAYCYQGSY